MRAISLALGALLAAAPLTAQAAPAKPDSTPNTGLVREVFAYEGGGRDPFVSLLRSGDVRPLLNDLKLVTVVYDGVYPGRSVAVLHDITNGKRYRVKTGEVVGRLRGAPLGACDAVRRTEPRRRAEYPLRAVPA